MLGRLLISPVPNPGHVLNVDYSLPWTDYWGAHSAWDLFGETPVRAGATWRWQGLPTNPELGTYIKYRTVGSWHSSLYKETASWKENTASTQRIVTLSSLPLCCCSGDHRWNWLKCARSHRVIWDRPMASVLFLHSSLSGCFCTKYPPLL